MAQPPRIVVIGAGPTGLGAAWRLNELGHDRWCVIDTAADPGGLGGSVVDPQGFTWDQGGHVVFSHYEYFDNLLDNLLGDQWVHHQRESWVWMRNRFIPYPMQNNIWRLPPDELERCLAGLVEVARTRDPRHPPKHFGEWIDQSFGQGLAETFMRPYNFKVWAYDPARLAADWVGDRVATVDLARIQDNIRQQRDDIGWGPNATFRFPLFGGNGAIWRALASRLPQDRLLMGRRVVAVDVVRREVLCDDDTRYPYDHLISTMPLDVLLKLVVGLPELLPLADRFVHSSTHIVGIGLGAPAVESLATKCWMYFPEHDVPFYRVTVFSNYSPNNVPCLGEQSSLMAEVSESPDKPVNAKTIVDDVVAGLCRAGLCTPDMPIVSRWSRRIEHGYPTPFLGRDALLAKIEPVLRSHHIFSRGRFGAWKYEVSNQDHSTMQGIEAVDHILRGLPEVTFPTPALANAPGKRSAPAS